ncbi:S66 peptidase family protein [Fulvitalea axinellae]
MLCPPILNKGDKVALVAPGGAVDEIKIRFAKEVIIGKGFEPVCGDHLLGRSNYFSGTDEERASDLQKALDDPEIKAVFMARGGYGITRIIDRLDFTAFLRNPKWLCGFSDITALLNHHPEVVSVHGPMPTTFSKDRNSTDQLFDFLMGKDLDYTVRENRYNKKGSVIAPLVGGNLTLVCHCLGSASEIDMDGKILFVEEIGEALYAIDRLMVQLKRAGKLANLAGIIVGQFSAVRDSQIPFGKDAYGIIRSHVEEYGYPCLFGFPAGHDTENLPLPISGLVSLDVRESENSRVSACFGNGI